LAKTRDGSRSNPRPVPYLIFLKEFDLFNVSYIVRRWYIMPRQARIIIDNVCYHTITRGNQKQVVFKEEKDFKKYLKLLSRYKSRYRVRIYAWCIMNNHVHMLIESGALSKFMHGLNLSYAQYFQFKYKTVGHVWQDRYKSFIIQKDSYLLNCVSYIEHNPVRADIVLKPEEYPWSSYSARALGIDNNLLDFIEF